VIVISSHSKKQSVFQALELGALDFIAKPTRHISPDLLVIREELIGKVMLFRHLRMDNLGVAKAAGMPQLVERKPEEPQAKERVPQPMASELRLVCIGASTGGPPAIQMLLAQLQENIPTCILVCQHMPAKFTKAFAERLDKTAKIKIKEAEDMDPLLAGSAYITPGGGNMIISRVDGRRVLRVVPGEPEDRYVPSIDKLFLSVADTFGNKALGIVLTGMGTDGKVGALKLRERGATVIAESKESAVIYGMPKEVIEAGASDLVLPLPKIGDALLDYCAGKKLEGAQGGR
jgi:two-component system chemotaxis response regulator CheB